MAGAKGKGWFETRAAREADSSALADSDEQHYRALFNYASDPIFCVDAETLCFVDLNLTACDALGYTRDELLGKPVHTIDVGVTKEELQRYVEQLNANGSGFLVSRHRRRDGTEYPVEVRSQARQWEGRLVYDSIARDLTQRQVVEEARRLADLAFQSAGRMAMVGAWTLDLRTGDPFFSDEVARIYGLPPGQSLPAEKGILHYPEDVRPTITQAVETAIADGTAYDLEIPFVTLQGKRRWVRTIGHADYDESRKPVRLFGALQDITQRKVAELLRQAQSGIRLKSTALTADDELTPVLDAFCAATRLMRIPAEHCSWLALSPAGPVHWGHGPSDTQSWSICTDIDNCPKSLLELLTDGATARDSASGSALKAQARAEAHTLVFARGQIALEIRSAKEAQFDEDEIMALEHLVNEVTEAHQRLLDLKAVRGREVQLQQSQKLESLGKLAGGVAHDFNNLLTVILGTCDLPQTEEPTLGAEDISIIVNAAERAKDLTQQLLAFGRRQMLRPRVVSVNDAVRRMVRMLERVLGETVEVIVRADAQHDTVYVDPTQIDQVVMNLVINARDAMTDGGTLTIETADTHWQRESPERPRHLPEGRFVRLSIHDTGSGIPDDIRPRIFEPFFTTKQEEQGTGLGLATVHGSVTQSGGHVEVRSGHPQGTIFDIYLPYSSLQTEVKRPVQGEYGGQDELVLLVEDQHAVRRMVHRMLQKAGYQVLEADGLGSVERLLTESPLPPRLVLTDVVLGDGSGPDVIAAVRRVHARTPVVFMSGYADHKRLDQALSVERSAFVPKPFTRQQLLKQLRESMHDAEE